MEVTAELLVGVGFALGDRALLGYKRPFWADVPPPGANAANKDASVEKATSEAKAQAAPPLREWDASAKPARRLLLLIGNDDVLSIKTCGRKPDVSAVDFRWARIGTERIFPLK